MRSWMKLGGAWLGEVPWEMAQVSRCPPLVKRKVSLQGEQTCAVWPFVQYQRLTVKNDKQICTAHHNLNLFVRKLRAWLSKHIESTHGKDL